MYPACLIGAQAVAMMGIRNAPLVSLADRLSQPFGSSDCGCVFGSVPCSNLNRELGRPLCGLDCVHLDTVCIEVLVVPDEFLKTATVLNGPSRAARTTTGLTSATDIGYRRNHVQPLQRMHNPLPLERVV